ncbi:signal peptidase I [Ornithinibacillus sp. L9]|uniref:Signal peptidase I n=1 Tax=Ornithinibacillus caprae TaxID=2678566 RepID=A0A6N8FDT9_9BACI|nr:signal peptidase I [Ornithinibacillus caprae]MUK87690.1 signal peptidase I [Ornithinibacillus caprae]
MTKVQEANLVDAALSQEKDASRDNRSSVMSWIMFTVLIVGVFLLFRFVIGFAVIAGNSMNPTLEDNDILLTSGVFYTVERSDVIVYRDTNGFDVIKRVIGMPNETVEIKDGVVFVNGTPLEENYVTGIPNDMPKKVVNEGSYFVIGDNRQPGASLDSRDKDVGTISDAQVQGKAILSIFPFGTMKDSAKIEE